MSDGSLWKYFTKEHHKEFVLSLNLFSPDPLLKKIQRNLLRNVLEGLPLSPHATAYRKGGNILDNAYPHQKQPLVLKMDIHDFFCSIPYLMVYRSAFPRIYYPASVAALLANLCCYQDYLPQGAPTSAAISNLVMKPFDDYMGKWCAERNISYTRYCDDMTFSGDFDSSFVFNKARSFLLSLGFEINGKKTRIIKNDRQQSVTGVVVNERPQVSRTYRDKLRQELYYLGKYGAASHLLKLNGGETLPTEAEQDAYLSSLLGKVNFVLQVDSGNQYFMQARALIRNMMTDSMKKSLDF